MPYGYTHAGVEWRETYLWTDEVDRPSEMKIMLYNDQEDELLADDDLEDVTTEPDDGLYGRASVLLGSGSDVTIEPPTVEEGEDPEGQGVLAHLEGVVFDVSGTTGVVDSWGAVLETQLQDDDSRRDHLILRVPLRERIDLDGWENEHDLEGAALSARPNL